MLYGAARKSRLVRFGRCLIELSTGSVFYRSSDNVVDSITTALLMALGDGRFVGQDELLAEAIGVAEELNILIPDELFIEVKLYLESKGWEVWGIRMFDGAGRPVLSCEWEFLKPRGFIPLFPYAA